MLTAFNVQSYQLLQPAPTDAMLDALQQISTQLNSFSINPSFINSTQPARSSDQLPPLPFRAPASAVWINALWFASLVCSLASASIALMVKQWLYEESQGLSGTSREIARRRQYRLNNLIKWKVGAIVLVPSLLLQLALFLFLAGLLILLWTIHEAVAAVITTLVGALFFFVLIVTILPIFRLDCCYRSPQALGAHTLARPIWNWTVALVSAGPLLVYASWRFSRVSARIPGVVASIIWNDTIRVALRWKSKFCIDTWNGREQREVNTRIGFLDRRIATMAYTTTFATEYLKALHIILSDLPLDQVFSCFSDIHGCSASLMLSRRLNSRSSAGSLYTALFERCSLSNPTKGIVPLVAIGQSCRPITSAQG